MCHYAIAIAEVEDAKKWCHQRAPVKPQTVEKRLHQCYFRLFHSSDEKLFNYANCSWPVQIIAMRNYLIILPGLPVTQDKSNPHRQAAETVWTRSLTRSTCSLSTYERTQHYGTHSYQSISLHHRRWQTPSVFWTLSSLNTKPTG